MVRRTQVEGFEGLMFTLSEWGRRNGKWVAIGAVVVVAAMGGTWLYRRSNALKEGRAAAALIAAEQSMVAGNAALAQSDLDKLVKRYPGTAAARQAAVQLAHLLYEKGQYQEGVARLEQLLPSVDDRDFKAIVEDQIGAGYEDMGKYADAARHYVRAAELARFAADSANYLASAARAHTSGGNVAEAKRIWLGLAADPTGPVAAEARVRLGELEARPARAGA